MLARLDAQGAISLGQPPTPPPMRPFAIRPLAIRRVALLVRQRTTASTHSSVKLHAPKQTRGWPILDKPTAI